MLLEQFQVRCSAHALILASQEVEIWRIISVQRQSGQTFLRFPSLPIKNQTWWYASQLCRKGKQEAHDPGLPVQKCEPLLEKYLKQKGWGTAHVVELQSGQALSSKSSTTKTKYVFQRKGREMETPILENQHNPDLKT